ncbi:MAG TPA: TadE/TadG family type IV pilus assembly protein [Candidatus Dormibacteraeota bacterium]|nr:TadE/TadG family type IV pilus assembly protein [Candidatus Dormibacteraeota bacterium]
MQAERRPGQRVRERGQALVEFALIAPVLIAFVLLTVDVGRAYWEAIDAAGAARAGARMGIISDTSDIGSAIRDEPNTGIPNTLAAWGSEGPGTSWGTCGAAGTCGDPNGCANSSFSGSQIACFAIRTCVLSNGDLGSCTSFSAWGVRPLSGGHGLQVVVVIKFTAVTPVAGQIINGGILFLRQSSIANELYF